MSHPSDVVGSGSHDYTGTYDPDTDFDAWYTRATAALIEPYLRPGQSVLELGCATGLMTSLLAPTGVTITGVERSAGYLARAESRKLAGVTYVQAELADYGTAEHFDHILATNLLHGFDDPTWLLRRIKGWLASGGLVHATLPNPDSIHRLAALAEGMIADPLVLSDKAVLYGTRHVWPAASFRDLTAANGLEVVATGGVTLKPYPNAVMARLPGPVLDGLVRAAALLPEYAAMHYTVLAHAGDRRAASS
jgi:2-polyprenyl-3-methyl-5-hydroxy-6-metoxy-1,4-benzoquinol methylase